MTTDVAVLPLFVQAVWTAAKTVFGDHVHVQGCFFHLTQSTWRKVQTLGLTTRYKDDEEVKQFCGMMDALAFLPTSDLKAGQLNTAVVCNSYVGLYIQVCQVNYFLYVYLYSP